MSTPPSTVTEGLTMNQDIEAVRRDISALRNGLLYPWQHDAAKDRILATLDHLTKANEELRAEVREQSLQYLATDGQAIDLMAQLTEARATIDRLTKERDEARAQFDNHVVWASGQAAELEAKVARLTKGRDSFATSYTHAAEERDEARTRLSAMQEGIDEAVRILSSAKGSRNEP